MGEEAWFSSYTGSGSEQTGRLLSDPELEISMRLEFGARLGPGHRWGPRRDLEAGCQQPSSG